MRQRKTLAISVPALAVALALTGCGAKKESGGSSSGHVVKIGMIAPLTGSLSALGLGMEHSADLAIKQANAANKIPGWTIQFDPQDDAEKPATGQAAATLLKSDGSVVGVVGTLQSSIALQAAPVLASANIVMISPANTNPSLTQGKNYLTAKSRVFSTYFRVATTDAVQAPFAAVYAYNKLGIRTVYLVNDKLVYGTGLTSNFQTEFTKLGGKVVGLDSVSTGQTDFGALVSKIRAAHPGLVYYGGQYPEGAPLAKQLLDAGSAAAFMGGDGLVDPSFIKTLGRQTAAAYATNVGAAVADLPGAQSFVTAYKAAGYAEDYSAYGPNSYDATNVIIAALAKVLPGKTSIDDSTRQAIVAAVQSTDLQGITGHVAFDEYGDTTNKVLTMYKVVGGKFVKEETGTFSG